MLKKNYIKGFSLLEVLFAFTILMIGLLGIIFLITILMAHNRLNNRMTSAMILAQDKIEDFQRRGYDNIDAIDETYIEDYQTIPYQPHFKRVTFINADYPETGMKTITVNVYWDANSRFIKVDTIISQ